jgi:hypothetical protein
VIAVLAREGDPQAEALASRWGSPARVVTPRDLARRGWVFRPGYDDRDAMVVGTERVATRELTAVVTRLPFVAPEDLATIVPADRPYVAVEMTAFLLAWLSSLRCPVVNRPSPFGLAGPNLRAEGWTSLAAQLDIPVRPVVRDHHGYASRGREEYSPVEVIVVGQRVLGATGARTAERARRLARRAGAEMLVTVFNAADADEPFLEAHTWPDFFRDDVCDALFEFLDLDSGGR